MTHTCRCKAAAATSWRAVGMGMSELQRPGANWSTGAGESVTRPMQPPPSRTSAIRPAAAERARAFSEIILSINRRL